MNNAGYDLNTAPGESRNRAASETKLAEELETQLFAHFKSIGCDRTDHRRKVGLNPACQAIV